MSNTNSYESPFCTRYASEEMQYIFLPIRNLQPGDVSGWLLQEQK